MGELTSPKVKSLGPGRHRDGAGLYLLVKESGTRSWLLRIQAGGKRRDLGLGPADTSDRSPEAKRLAAEIPILQRHKLTLAEAREKAEAYTKMVKGGIDPVAERKKTAPKIPTFDRAASDCHEELKKGWRNQKHSDSWLASLENHVSGAFGSKPVDQIDSLMVRDALAPIWLTIPETARRILQRIGAVLDFAHIKGWRPSETSLKSVRKGLPRQPNEDNHFDAMPYEEVPGFVEMLQQKSPTAGRDALLFTLLNAVRSNETRFATWPEIDLEKGTWTIPGARMKMGQTHVVPLAPAAIAILDRRKELRTKKDGLVFFSSAGKPLSDMTMTKVLRDEKITGAHVHGFRSSFTDWAAEMTSIPKEVVDKALAHKLPDRVEAAYRRTDFFERRRVLMASWADYVAGDKCSGEIIPIKGTNPLGTKRQSGGA